MSKEVLSWGFRAAMVVAMSLEAGPTLADPVPNPGQEAAKESKAPEPEGRRGTLTWDLPPLVVDAPPLLREEERIGDYAQPRWSARRRFPNTRIYVRPAGMADFEWWFQPKINLEHPDEVRLRSQYEIELGLGYRLQLDLYLMTEQNGWDGPLALQEEKIELRWAWADWGELWGNPTLYVEYAHDNSGPPRLEGKLLLGGEMASGVHGGLNVVYERQLGGAGEQEYALTGGVSATLVDSDFSFGGEAQVEALDVEGSRFDFNEVEVLAGPSLQWFPVPEAHIDLVAYFGPGFQKSPSGDYDVEPIFEPTLIVGYEF